MGGWGGGRGKWQAVSTECPTNVTSKHKFEYDPENKMTDNWKIRQGKKEMDKGKGKEKMKK